MNIGFLEAMRRFPEANCVMFHDVDHLLEDDRALMYCGPNPRHYAAAMDEWNYRSEQRLSIVLPAAAAFNPPTIEVFYCTSLVRGGVNLPKSLNVPAISPKRLQTKRCGLKCRLPK